MLLRFFHFTRFSFLGLCLFTFSVTLLLLPVPVTAAGLVPCGRTADDPATTGLDEAAPCTVCHLIVGGKGVIDYGLKIMTYVAIAVLVAMAILYIVSTGNEGLMKTAKGGIMASLIGFAVMLGAWLIVNTTLNILAVNDTNTQNPLFGLRQNGTFSFSCDTASSASSASGASSFQGGGGAFGGTGASGSWAPAPSGGSGGAACTDPAQVKASLAAGNQVCAGVACTKPKCNFSPSVENAINTYSGTLSKSFVKALICQESGGNVNAVNTVGASTSCGLMQVNANEVGNTTCTGPAKNLFDPAVNVQEGVRVFKNKMNQVNPATFGNLMTQEQMALAAYNCCDNGDNPNAQSASCKATDGWPAITKWACPIAPGNSSYNMCAVKSYACGITACVSQY